MTRLVTAAVALLLALAPAAARADLFGSSAPGCPASGCTFSGPVSVGAGLNVGATKSNVTNATVGVITGLQTINSGSITGSFAPFNIIQVTEAVGVPSGTGQGFYTQLNTGGAGATGGRQALQGDMTIYATTGNSGGQYTGVQGNFFGNVPDGTTSIGYGGNFTAQLKGTATGWKGLVGTEVDIGAQTGTTTTFIAGFQVVGFGNGVVAGSTGIDSAYVIGHQDGFVGWDYGFRISGIGGTFPIKTTGKVFGVATGAPLNGGTVATGFDLTGLTITGNAWVSPGYTVDGSGNLSALTVVAQGAANKLTLAGAATTVAPGLSAQGTDTNVALNINTKGTGGIFLRSNLGSNTMFSVGNVAGSDSPITVLPGIVASQMSQIFQNGTGNNIMLGGPIGGGALTAAATTAFPAMPFTTSAPSGVPVNNANGAAFETNTGSKTLNIYIPGVGWYHAALTVGAA